MVVTMPATVLPTVPETMPKTRAARRLRRGLAAAALLLAGPALAQHAPEPSTGDPSPPARLGAAPAPFKPDAATEAQPDVWIFSGELQGSHESFSGTLVAAKPDAGNADAAKPDAAKPDAAKPDAAKADRGATAQFELKLGSGATCDGSQMSGEVGLVRLGEITCTDDRVMRALFVPQGGQELKVFGHVGDERFMASAHLLGTEAVPEKGQTAQPTAPALQRPNPAGPAGAAPGR